MAFYNLLHADEGQTAALIRAFPLLARLTPESRQKTADALLTCWKNSAFPNLEDAPFSRHCTHYRLLDHINEVAEMGMQLADFAQTHWQGDPVQTELDRDLLLQVLLLHDADKFLLLSDEHLEKRIAHGTLSALLLQELGFAERVIELVACHSPKASVHIPDPIAMILHYCDLFSCDHIYLLIGRPPFFCGKG